MDYYIDGIKLQLDPLQQVHRDMMEAAATISRRNIAEQEKLLELLRDV